MNKNKEKAETNSFKSEQTSGHRTIRNKEKEPRKPTGSTHPGPATKPPKRLLPEGKNERSWHRLSGKLSDEKRHCHIAPAKTKGRGRAPMGREI